MLLSSFMLSLLNYVLYLNFLIDSRYLKFLFCSSKDVFSERQQTPTDCLGIGLPFLNILTILHQELLQYTSTVVAVLPVCACSWDSLHSLMGGSRGSM